MNLGLGVRRASIAGAAAGVVALTVVQAGMATPAQAAGTGSGQPTTTSAAAGQVRATLHANRQTARRWQEIVLTGTGHAGSTVVVEQRVGSGHWTRFPASSVVRKDGGFRVRVESGRSGKNQFRVRIAGSTSAAVTVQVGHATATPVLGRGRTAPPITRGFGHAHPRTIDNGGDPSGIASKITWTNWGAATTTGRGSTSIFKPAGGYYAKPGAVEFRADRIRTCSADGTRAYSRLIAREVTKPGSTHWTRWFTWASWKNVCPSS